MVWIIAFLTLALQSNARQPVIVALGDSMTAGYGSLQSHRIRRSWKNSCGLEV